MRPLLTGLLGSPWLSTAVEARCHALDPVGVGARERGRYHRAVPAVGCTCGIYAAREGLDTRALPPARRSEPSVEGFVKLTGRIIVGPNDIRAERAEIIGPLVVRPGRPPWLAPRSWVPARLVEEPGRYRMAWRPSPGTADLLDDLAAQLADRYEVSVLVGSA